MDLAALVFVLAAFTPTLPAANADTPAVPGVLVTVFKPDDQSATGDWIAQSLQQALSSEVGRLRGLRAIAPKDGIPGATYAVTGTYQLTGGSLRLTGQVVHSSGKGLGEIRAAGALRDLFALEDSLCEQLKRILESHQTAAAPTPHSQAQLASASPTNLYAIQPVGHEVSSPQRTTRPLDTGRYSHDVPDPYAYPVDAWSYYRYPNCYMHGRCIRGPILLGAGIVRRPANFVGPPALRLPGRH